MITHLSRRWAVGHGGFYTGEVRSGERWEAAPIRYVYDCGAKRRTLLDAAVDEYVDGVRADGGAIDLVVISHVDADHVNGLPRLIAAPDVPVHRVMLPLLTPVERLIAVARSAETADADDGPSPEPPDDDELEFRLFPEQWLRERGIEVVVVTGDDDDGGGGEPLGIEPVPDDGFGAARQGRPEPHHHPDGPQADDDAALEMVKVGFGAATTEPDGVHRMSHRNGIRIADRVRGAAWILVPYVSPRITAQRAAFVAELAGSEQWAAEFEQSLAEPDELRRWAIHELPRLRDAYAAAGGTNAGSMTLFSGPLPSGSSATTIFFGDPSIGPRGPRDVRSSAASGTLLTGDSELIEPVAVGDLAHHYTGYTRSIGILDIPHHGSAANSSSQLFAIMPNLACGLAMVPDTSTHHPAQSVMDAVRDTPAIAHAVTTQPATTVVTATDVT